MSDMLSGVSSLYNQSDYSSSTSSLQNNLTNTDYSTATEDELMEACKQFEQYFVEQAFKGMEKMVPKSDDSSSTSTSYVDMFKDKLYTEYAQSASDRGDGIGIAKQLYEQMKRNYDL